MKNAAALMGLALFFWGCEAQAGPQPVNPIFASYSNVFGFEPVRGKVKSFLQQQRDENGALSSSFQANLSETGCFESLKVVAPLMGLNVDLIRKGRYLVNRSDQKGRYSQRDNCLLESNLDDNTRYIANNKGFITVVINGEKSGKNVYFQYDASGFPSRVSQPTAKGPFVATITGTESDEKKRNNTIQTRFKGVLLGEVVTRCEYDDHFNATHCTIESQPAAGGKSMPKELDDPETTQIEYY